MYAFAADMPVGFPEVKPFCHFGLYEKFKSQYPEIILHKVENTFNRTIHGEQICYKDL